MPIITTQNKQTKLSASSSKATVTPKLFNAKLTGHDTAKRGYFNQDHYTARHLVDIYNAVASDKVKTTVKQQLFESRNPHRNETTSKLDYKEVITTSPYQMETLFNLQENKTITSDDIAFAKSHPNPIKIHTFTNNNAKVIAEMLPQIPKVAVLKNSKTDFLIYPAIYCPARIYRDDLNNITHWQLANEKQVDIKAGTLDILVNSNALPHNTGVIVLPSNYNQEDSLRSYISHGLLTTSRPLDKLNIYQLLKHQASLLEDKQDHIKIIESLIKTTYTWSRINAFNALKQITKLIPKLSQATGAHYDNADIAVIAEAIQNHPSLDKNQINTISNADIQLKLATNIMRLANTKKDIKRLVATDSAKKEEWDKRTDYSRQQKNIIMSEEPLIIAQAGAGSGKTHTVAGRLKYMKDQGIDLSKTLVLSFTNIAADTLKKRFPEIQSITLASMFDDIYRTNYPKQELASAETLENTLKLINPAFFQQVINPNTQTNYTEEEIRNTIMRFSSILRYYATSQNRGVRQRVSLNDVTANLIKLISDEQPLIEAFLDATGQTTLEIEPVMISHLISKPNTKIKTPDRFESIDFIITDESQDISTFEYTLLLELIIQHKAQFMIVGDGSQTLYEFRSSDPRYLNALEASGIFTNYKLNTNYRSHQAILAYANEFLNVIDANKVAQIQLQSNDLTDIDITDINNRIQIQSIHREHGGRSNKITHVDELESRFWPVASDYITEKLENGEQVAILAWSRREVETIKEVIEYHRPDIKITSLLKDKQNMPSLWTRALRNIKKELEKVSFKSKQEFESNIKALFNNHIAQTYAKSPRQTYFFQQQIEKALFKLFQTLQWRAVCADITSRKATTAQAIGYLTQYLTRYEQKVQAMEQHLKSNQAEDLDLSQEKLIVSTIHGVKGAEFQNVVIIHDNDKYMRQQDNQQQEYLRMMFVALSRAEESELIVETRSSNFSATNEGLTRAMFKDPIKAAYEKTLIKYTKDDNE